MPTDSTPGRSIVTRRAVVDIVRTATLGSYGVTGLGGRRIVDRVLDRLGLGQPGIRIGLTDDLTIDLDLTVGTGLPIAEVARQVDSAVRYAVRRALGREVDRLAIRVDGLRVLPASMPGAAPSQGVAPVRQDDLAASGTDVAG